MNDTAIQRTAPTGMELLAELSRKVSDPTAAVELAKQIVELQTRQEGLRQSYARFEWEKLDRQAKVSFAQAFEQFKAQAPKILKTKHVNYPSKNGGKDTDYWHVELDKACDLLIPALLKEGITHQWMSTDLPDGRVRVTCILRHRLGYESEGASLAGPADQSGGKNAIQGVGSSTSYLERYTFLMTCGIVPTGTDNDGNPLTGMTNDEAGAFVAAMNEAEIASDVMKEWAKANDAAAKKDPMDYRAMVILRDARDERLKTLKKGAK